MLDYKSVFTNKIGRLKYCKIKLQIDQSIKPTIQSYRRPPYHLAAATEKAIDELIENDIVETAPAPIKWLSQLVIVPKEKKPNEVRITVDCRVANKAIIKTNYVTPTLEEIKYDLKDAKVFSEMDCNKAFHQLELADEESKNITTFESERGPLRYKRLHMGVHCASEIFQNEIRKALKGLVGVKNIADNILVHGKDRNEHDKRLIFLCQRLVEIGLTCSPDNCKLGVEEINFFGLKLSKDGVAISDEKVKALKEAAPPKSASELRSSLGLSIWCSFHIPDLATIAQPLWDLTREGTAFRWEENHAEVIEGIKARLITTALRFFNIDWITQVICDASPVGLGAVLSQTNPKNEKEKGVVMYLSRMLTDVERRYSQMEKEALGIVWACERLYLYLFGKQFQLLTDNRAVQLFFNNPNSNPPL